MKIRRGKAIFNECRLRLPKPRKFSPKYLNSRGLDEGLQALKEHYPIPGIKIGVRKLPACYEITGMASRIKIGEKHEIRILDRVIEPRYEAYLLFKQYLYIFLEKKNPLDFYCDKYIEAPVDPLSNKIDSDPFLNPKKNEEILGFLLDLKTLANNYLIEKEIRRQFKNSFGWVVGKISDEEIKAYFSSLVVDNWVSIFMCALTCKAIVRFYPELKDTISYRILGNFEGILLTLKKLSMKNLSNYRSVIFDIFKGLTGANLFISGKTPFIEDVKSVRDFFDRIRGMLEPTLPLIQEYFGMEISVL